MNYFPFNLGDYAAHTAHLEEMEDLAYRRMLDLYYLHEKALPADIAEVARLVRLRKFTGDVESVLREFFVLGDTGWSHLRCDEEITKMRAKLDASEEKDQHEKDRMQRYRERRAAMFAALREHGIVPAYDIAMKDLQRLFDEKCNAPATPVTEPATPLQREQAVSGNADATAIPTTTTTTTTITKERESSAKAPRSTKKCPVDFEVTPDMEQWAAEHKVTVDLKTETEKFKDYTFNRAMADWLGAWRNWIRNAQEFAGKSPKAGSYTPQNSHKYAAAGRAIFDDDEPENSIKHMGDVINA